MTKNAERIPLREVPGKTALRLVLSRRDRPFAVAAVAGSAPARAVRAALASHRGQVNAEPWRLRGDPEQVLREGGRARGVTGGPGGQVNFDLLTTTESRTPFRRAGRVTLLFLWGGASDPLIEIVDDLVMRAPLLQAMVGASGMPPMADFNPYEVACGIPPGRSHSERWTARWLLGCDTNLWLSQALVDRIDTGKLDRVAVRSAEDSKHHIRLRQGHTIEELELALAPILPSLADWLQAQGPIGRLEWRRKKLVRALEGRLFQNEWFNRVVTPKLVTFAEWREERRSARSET